MIKQYLIQIYDNKSGIAKCHLPAFLCPIFVLCCFLNCVISANNEFYSSVSGLENLLNAETVMLDDLQHYVNSIQNHINMLQSGVDYIRLEHAIATENIDGYLSNPVNAYLLIKRLQSDWNILEESIRVHSSRSEFLDAMKKNRRIFNFPTKEDVTGSAIGLVRLQDTYKLDVVELANGILNGNKYGSSMSWQDCFLLGQHLYEVSDFNHTILWLKQSVELLKKQENPNDPSMLDFMETIVDYYKLIGDFETALDLVNYILTIDATREGNVNIRLDLERMISNGIKMGLMHELRTQTEDYHLTEDFKQYEKVCRGELLLTATEQRSLKCHFENNKVPYRILQPFKVEELYLDPRIVQIHDVFSTNDSIAIKEMAKKRISRSEVGTIDGTTGTTVNYRISKSAWFAYNESRQLQIILRYMGDLSGLSLDSAEELQVANYGIGGHYEPHFDFFMENSSSILYDGNRIATGIFYLSDVEEGGGTVFPYLRILVKPQHGSVLFWYNLHRSGEPDYRTRHAACPVLKGSKWIGNIWLRMRNQDRKRPCELKPDHKISLKYRDFK